MAMSISISKSYFILGEVVVVGLSYDIEWFGLSGVKMRADKTCECYSFRHAVFVRDCAVSRTLEEGVELKEY